MTQGDPALIFGKRNAVAGATAEFVKSYEICLLKLLTSIGIGYLIATQYPILKRQGIASQLASKIKKKAQQWRSDHRNTKQNQNKFH